MSPRKTPHYRSSHEDTWPDDRREYEEADEAERRMREREMREDHEADSEGE